MSVRLSVPTKLYQLLVRTAEPLVPQKLVPLWNHPAGQVLFNLSYIHNRE